MGDSDRGSPIESPGGASAGQTASALPVVALGAGLTAATTSVLNLVLPDINRDLGSSASESAWFVLAFLVSLLVALPVAGRLSDAWGYGHTYVGGFAMFGVASLGCACTPGVFALVFTRAVQGGAAAFIIAATPALVAALARPGSVGRALGWLSASTYAGLAVGPLLGGHLVGWQGWRAVFFASAFVSAAVVSIGLILIPFDVSRSELGPRREAETTERTTSLWSPALSSMVGYAASGGCLFLVAFALRDGLALSASAAGLLLSANATGLALGAAVSGFAIDAVNPRKVAVIGMVVMAAGLIGLSGTVLGAEGWRIALSLALVGIGAGMFVPANTRVVLAQARPKRRGTASGLLSLSRNLGAACGVAIVSAMLGMAVGDAGWTDTANQTVVAGLSVGAVLSLVAAVLSARGEPEPVAVQEQPLRAET